MKNNLVLLINTLIPTWCFVTVSDQPQCLHTQHTDPMASKECCVAPEPSFPAIATPVYYETPSCTGHGTLEILKVTQILEGAGISCCLVETSALIYYGANMVRCVSHVIRCVEGLS